MTDPFKQLASLIDMRISERTARVISGLPCELGTITATGLKLDNFKHEIQHYYVADWLVQLHLPAFSLIGTATSPVDEQGNPLAGASTSQLTRYDFRAAQIKDVRVNLKAGLKPGERVLVVPINRGQEAIVIARVMAGA
ncbi:hypothetical protein SAMN00808754_2035 [Thermanaeromonas toyohensis ToBE]|uniref:Uncharacterized protein n=1 Tax=Thermanaeromonas toyohensis ToBE TaxID=698762 RepID=A0A1W1VYL6_9FIRM|nr:hypothetical protein [Thermanaeromonas toyohensis]SMB97934.1 hypothetical protein SAMN00808754_2035 [Thermanaeromonas toyohensis ToBE]